MDAHTGMEVPIGMVKLRVPFLSGLNRTWCNTTLKSYNGTICCQDETSTRLLTFTVVLMLLLGFFLLCFSILRHVFGQQTLNLCLGGYNLYSAVCIVLRVTFIVFLPLLSSVFSHTKCGDDNRGQSRGGSRTELLLMLLWLLLVELIRKKVQVMNLPTDGSSFTRGIGRFTLMDYADELGYLTWTGYLIYSNIMNEKAITKAIFISLWSISMVKLLQRLINTRQASHSWRTARNPLLIAGYMQHVIMENEQEDHSSSAASASTASTSAFAIATMETCTASTSAPAPDIMETCTASTSASATATATMEVCTASTTVPANTAMEARTAAMEACTASTSAPASAMEACTASTSAPTAAAMETCTASTSAPADATTELCTAPISATAAAAMETSAASTSSSATATMGTSTASTSSSVAATMETCTASTSAPAAATMEMCTASTFAPAAATMETCKFVVAKEHKLVPTKEKGTLYCIREPRVVGVHLNLTKTNELVTVGKIWKLKKDHDPLFHGTRGTYLENLCLSFSLFKLLRRLFERYPMVEVGSFMGRRIMIKGLLNLDDDDGNRSHHRPFEVLQLELEFLHNYYQAADPVVMSNPILFFINFALSMLLVPIYLASVLVTLITNKDAAYLYCKARGWNGENLKFPFLYLAITMALLATVIFIEATEFVTSYLLANWNTVRLVCSYSIGQRWLLQNISYYFVKFRFLVHHVPRSLAKHVMFRCGEDDTKINQVSIVDICWPVRPTYKCTCQATLGKKAKEDIIKSLRGIDIETGHIRLQPPSSWAEQIRGPAEDIQGPKSITEIILMCHFATELYEIDHQKKEKNKLRQDGARNMTPTNKAEARSVANTLSRYCMYLVESMPALLPDDETWISKRANEMRSCLTSVIRQCCSGCIICMPISQCCKHKMVDSLKMKDLNDLSTSDALKLKIDSWDVLASFWIDLLIYLAPSDNIQGHAKMLASSGGELISYLWAFCTHAGITRLPLDAGDDNPV